MKTTEELIRESTGGTGAYNASVLTYAGSFASPWKRGLIRTSENLTGRLRLLWLVRKWEVDPDRDPNFWKSVLDRLDIMAKNIDHAAIGHIDEGMPVVAVHS